MIHLDANDIDDDLLDALYEDARAQVWGQLQEGIFDPYILKAVFLAGGGGSGKGFISSLMFGTTNDMATTSWGIKSMNSDDILTALAGQLPAQQKRTYRDRSIPGQADIIGVGLGGREQLDLRGQLGSVRGQATRDYAKELGKTRLSGFLNGRLGVIIDGTAAKPDKTDKIKKRLESLGYDCSMVFVNTALNVALARNLERKRKVPEKLVIQAHGNVQRSATAYRRMFGNHVLLTRETAKAVRAPGMVEIDNSVTVSKRDIKKKLSPLLWKTAQRILQAPLVNPIGWEWLEAETTGMPDSLKKKVAWIGKKKGA